MYAPHLHSTRNTSEDYTTNPLYPRIPICKSTFLLKFIGTKDFASQSPTRGGSAFLFQLPERRQASFRGLYVPRFMPVFVLSVDVTVLHGSHARGKGGQVAPGRAGCDLLCTRVRELRPGMGPSAGGHESNVSASIMCMK